MVNIKPRDFEFPLTDDQHHYLARQPVFGPLQQVMAYDLIHCGAAADDDVGTCLAKHIDLLSAGRQVFVPATNGLIQSRDGLPLPPDGQQVVVVFPADIEVGDELLETVNHMTRKGYLIALGDFDYGKNHNALLPYADFIRLSVRGHSDLTLQRLLASLHEFRVRLIAEHVDSLGEFRRAQTLGFDGFMGGFYRQPHNAGPRDLSPASVSLLRLAVLVQEENLDARELERLISEDVVLSFQLLRYINSAAFSLRHKVESIRHAIVLLGHAEIRKWSALISILSANNKPNELIRTALWRASMCELLCEESGQGNPGTAVIVGLFSLLDTLYDRPLDELLDLLMLADDVRDALLHGQGDYAEVLACVLAYERSDWPAVQYSLLTPAHIGAVYLRAVRRADQVMKGLFDHELETGLVTAG